MNKYRWMINGLEIENEPFQAQNMIAAKIHVALKFWDNIDIFEPD